MNYKHACVIDAENLYKIFVLVLLTQADQGEEQEWKVQNYTLAEGEQLIDTAPPIMRPYAGAVGFVSPRWDAGTSSWAEAATGEEIAAWEAEHPNPYAKTLEEKKEELISISNKELDLYLKEHPITWVDGQQYSVTEEKQGLLTSNIALYQLSVQSGNPRELKWNTTGDVCTVWTIENLSALALAIGDYVQPYVTYQQTVEVQIKECTTMEELESIVIDYSTVSTVKPEVLTGEQGS